MPEGKVGVKEDEKETFPVISPIRRHRLRHHHVEMQAEHLGETSKKLDIVTDVT